MFKSLSILLLSVVALTQTVCGQVPLPTVPTALQQLPYALQALVAPTPTPALQLPASADASSPAPNAGVQSNPNPDNRPQTLAAFLRVFHQLGWHIGVLTNSSGGQLNIRTAQAGAEQVVAGPSTIIVVAGSSGAVLSDIHRGDRVIANIPKGQSVASLVLGVPKDYDKDNILLGAIQSNSSGAMTLRTRAGSETLATSATTQFIKVVRDGVALATVSDVQAGDLLIAIGQPRGDDFAAQAAFLLPKGALNLGKGLNKGGKNSSPPNSGG